MRSQYVERVPPTKTAALLLLSIKMLQPLKRTTSVDLSLNRCVTGISQKCQQSKCMWGWSSRPLTELSLNNDFIRKLQKSKVGMYTRCSDCSTGKNKKEFVSKLAEPLYCFVEFTEDELAVLQRAPIDWKILSSVNLVRLYTLSSWSSYSRKDTHTGTQTVDLVFN